jgi:site-specific DNA-cytosine methylase
MRGRYDENKKIKQKIEYNQTEKSNSITTVQKDSLIGYPVALIETRTEEVKKSTQQLVFSQKSQTLLATIYKENAKSMVKRNKKGLLVGSKLTDFGQYNTEGIHYRKLTPIECERLQTVPDNYTNHVSNTQRYKMLGNGWTVDVIAHIFKKMEL